MRRGSDPGWIRVILACSALAAGSCMFHHASSHPVSRAARHNALERAQVWQETDIAAKDIINGPQGEGAFKPGDTVNCTYTERDMNGRSPKFVCRIDNGAPATGAAAGAAAKPDDVKVKYGLDNAEVYGEMLSTRLLWALGFGADRMYSVRVVCRGCPESIQANETLPSGERVFDPALIERKFPGREIETYANQGWAWWELDKVNPKLGGAPLAQRDALKLLAVFIQHSDSKPDQQRLACLDPETPKPAAKPDEARHVEAPADARCEHPFMLVQDTGLTWGRTDIFFHKENYVNLSRWADTTVWAPVPGCVGNLYRPFLGTLERPPISEEGRQFLAGLMNQLTDAQIRDLFTAARVQLRSRAPNRQATLAKDTDGAIVDEWVAAFKKKRQEITDRRCPAATGATK